MADPYKGRVRTALEGIRALNDTSSPIASDPERAPSPKGYEGRAKSALGGIRALQEEQRAARELASQQPPADPMPAPAAPPPEQGSFFDLDMGRAIAESPFFRSAVQASTALAGHEQGDKETTLRGHLEEVGRGIPRGAANLYGTGVRGIAALKHGILQQGQKRGQEQVAQIATGLQGWNTLTPEQREELRFTMRIATGVPADVREELARGFAQAEQSGTYQPGDQITGFLENPPIPPLTEDPLFEVGTGITDRAGELFPRRPGYEDSTGGNIGEGLGSVGAGVVASATLGPAAAGGLFAGAGTGEAVDRAIADGATEDEIIEAARLGLIPGLTDSVPVETLLGRIPIPGVGRIKLPEGALGDALEKVSDIGTQAFIEGVQEGGQEFLQNLIAREVYKPEQELLEGVPGASGEGFTVGGIVAGIRELMFPGRQRGKVEIIPEGAEDKLADAPEAEPVSEAAAQPNAKTPAETQPEEVPAAEVAAPAGDDVIPEPGAGPETEPEADGGQLRAGTRVRFTYGGEAMEGEITEVYEVEDADGGEPETGVRIKTSEGVVDDFASGLEIEPLTGTRKAPATAETREDIAAAEAKVAAEPTEAQKEAGNYAKGHVKVQGLDVTIENAKGQVRTGRDADGNEWSVDMPAAYGYVKRTTGADGEQVDVYLGDEPQADTVFVIDQTDADTMVFDEHKVMVGFPDAAAARATYEAGFSDGRGADRLGGMTAMSMDEFKDWLKKGDTRGSLQDVATDADEAVSVRVTREGPWDFNETYPAPDPERLRALNDQGRRVFDHYPPGADEVIASIDEGLNELVIANRDLREYSDELARARAGAKPPKRKKREDWIAELENDVANARQTIDDVRAAHADIFGESTANRILSESRYRALQEEKTTATQRVRPGEREDDAPAQAPEKSAPTSIGENAQGFPIFQDENGARSYVQGDVMVHEPVASWVRNPRTDDRFMTEQERSEVRKTQVKEDPAAAAASAPEQESADRVLVDALKPVIVKASKPITQRQLSTLAKDAYGGTVAQGAYDPRRAYDALEVAVNELFAERRLAPMGDAARTARDIRSIEAVLNKLPNQSRRTGSTDAFQQFSTPPHYAFIANWLANIRPGDQMLEPSAGNGGLAVFAHNSGADVVANELDPQRRANLEMQGFRVFGEDAEQIDNILPDDVAPDVVVMNPPFSNAGARGVKRDQSISTRHIQQALNRLRDGGRLVAIVGQGFGQSGKTKAGLEKIAKNNAVRASIAVDGKVYRKYGTAFGTRIIVIDKVAPDGKPTETHAVEVFDAPTLEALEGIRNDRTYPRERAGDEPAGRTDDAGRRDDAGRNRPVRDRADEVGAGKPDRRLEDQPSGRPSADDGTASRKAAGRSDEVSDGGRADRSEPRGDGARDRSGASAEPSAQSDGRDGRGVSPGGSGALKVKTRRKAQTGKTLGDGLYDAYVPQMMQIEGAQQHSTPLVQSAAMASVEPPKPTYQPALPESIAADGVLSEAQLEAVVYAGQAHAQTAKMWVGGDLGEQEVTQRRGFFIGDGTGVGKGREISGILLDNWNQGRRKAVWISEKGPLFNDAKRDFGDVGGPVDALFDMGKVKADAVLDAAEGIAFTTYDRLKMAPQGKQSRLDQLVNWLGEDFDGVIAFDEAHNMGNAVTIKGKRGQRKASAKAMAGVDLQRRLPDARVVYVSATGATEVENLSYADRLRLWGPGTAFASREKFITQISQGGLAAMELVARDLKAMGLYVARSLSFDGVGYTRVEHSLTDNQRAMYDTLARAWQTVLQNIDAALELTGGENNPNAKSAAYSAFWGGHQRFFNQVLTSMQMPTVLRAMEKDLANGMSPVLQLVNTNEAAQERAIAGMAEDATLEDLDLTPRDQLMQLVEKSFPTTQHEEYFDDDGNKRSRPVRDSKGNPVESREAVQLREDLLAEIGMVRVPDGPLEMILNKFGVDQVAEVTGRTRRVVEVKGRRKLERRGSQANVAEADDFMSGKKLSLIFSNAGGTGRSYHAALNAKNQRPRAHYLLQPGWSAAPAIQGFGRTHRTNQAQPPEYRLVSTDAKGQKRFISSIARRLDQLGALTRGQRQTGGQGMFSASDNLESDYARLAVTGLVTEIAMGRLADEGLPRDIILNDMGLKVIDDDTGALVTSKIPSVPTFLNRLLSLELDKQDLMFVAFEKRLDDTIERAREEGSFDVGVEVLRGETMTKKSDKVIVTDPETGAETRYVVVDRGEKAKIRQWADVKIGAQPDGQYKVERYVRNVRSGRVYALTDWRAATDDNGQITPRYRLYTPTAQRAVPQSDFTSWNNKYEEVSAAEAKVAWEKEVGDTPAIIHSDVHLITGTILPVWDRLKDSSTFVYRVPLDSGETILGREIPGEVLHATLDALGATAEAPKMSATEVVDAVLQGGARVRLANGYELSRRALGGEPRVRVGNVDMTDFHALRSQGLQFERVGYESMLFLPENDMGMGWLEQLLERVPVASVVKAGQDQFSIPANQGPFYSGLLRAAEGLSQSKGTGQQFLAALRKQPGVKPDEIEWTGLDDFLSGRAKVTRDEVVQFVRDNQVQVSEVRLVGLDMTDEEVRDFHDLSEEVWSDTTEAERRQLEMEAASDPEMGGGGPARYADHATETSEGYTELLLRLPKSADTYQSSHWEQSNVLAHVRFGTQRLPVKLTEAETKAAQERQRLLPEWQRLTAELNEAISKSSVERDILIQQEVDALRDRMKAGEFDGPGGMGEYKRLMNDARFGVGIETPSMRRQVALAKQREALNLPPAVTRRSDKTLLIDEIQSDWHQEGRKKGYGPKIVYEVHDAQGVRGVFYTREKAEEKVQEIGGGDILETPMSGGVPNAPFKKTWHELAFRRMVKWASDNGFDSVGWVAGEQQADRYDLSKSVDFLLTQDNGDGTYKISAQARGRGHMLGEAIAEDRLSEYVGTSVAERIVEGQGEDTNLGGVSSSNPPDVWKRLDGEDLKVGGEGMRAFYDKILPAYANKFGKKFGAKVTTGELEDGTTFWTLPVTDEMRAAAKDGLPLFARGAKVADRKVALADLRKQLKAYGLQDQLAVRVVDAIEQTGNGAETPAQGRYFERLIDVARNAADPSWVLDHEIIHGLRDIRVLRPQEWVALYRAATADKALMASIRDRYAGRGLNEDQMVEEAVADMFATWRAGQREHRGIIKRAMERIRNFIEALGQALAGNGFTTAEDVFRGIESGEVGARAAAGSSSDARYSVPPNDEPAPKGAFESLLGMSDAKPNPEEVLERVRADRATIAEAFRGVKPDDGVRVIRPKKAGDALVWKRAIYTPELIFKKYSDPLYGVWQHAVNAMDKASRITRELQRDVSELTAELGETQMLDLSALLFKGDALETEFTKEDLDRGFVGGETATDEGGKTIDNVAERREWLVEEGRTIDPKVRDAYLGMRRFMKKLGRMTDMHERKMLPTLRRRKLQLIRRLADMRQMEVDAFRKLVNEMLNLRSKIRRGETQGDESLQAMQERVREAEARVLGTMMRSGEIEDGDFVEAYTELLAIESRLQKTSVQTRKGYFPHKFFGSFMVVRRYEMSSEGLPADVLENMEAISADLLPVKVREDLGLVSGESVSFHLEDAPYDPDAEAEGTAVGTEGGRPQRVVLSKLITNPKDGFFQTIDDAIRAANAYVRGAPGADLTVKPVEFSFPEAQATQLTDAAYHRFVGNVSNLLGVSYDDAMGITRESARKRFRRRIAGFKQFRKGIAGYSKEFEKVIDAHLGQTVRYITMDELKYIAINAIEKEGLSPNRSSVQERPVLAAIVNNWLRDLNGQKQPLESQIDELFDKPWAKPLNIGLGAGLTSFLAAGGVSASIGVAGLTGAAVPVLVGSYVGYRFYKATSQGSAFPTRAITGAMLNDMAHLKLGAFFNLFSPLVNTTQLIINAYPVLGEKYLAAGISRYTAAMTLGRNVEKNREAAKAKGEIYRPTQAERDFLLLRRANVDTAFKYSEQSPNLFERESSLSKLSLFWFNQAENLNRGSTFLGAYARAEGSGFTPGQAFRSANDTMRRTQFDYSNANKPEVLRNVLARVPLQFKNYMTQQIAFIMGLDAKELPRFIMAVVLMAGALGLPFLDLLDILTGWIFGEDKSALILAKEEILRQHAAGESSGTAADIVARGLPALVGVDLVSRVGMGEKFLPTELRDFKGPWWSTIENAITFGGENATVVDQVRNLSAGLGAPLKSIEAAANGLPLVETLVTDPAKVADALQDDVYEFRSPWQRGRLEYQPTLEELLLKSVGGSPIYESNQRLLRDVAYAKKEGYAARRKKLTDDIVRAIRAGDTEALEEARQRAIESRITLTNQVIRNALVQADRPRLERVMRNLPKDLRPDFFPYAQAIDRGREPPEQE